MQSGEIKENPRKHWLSVLAKSAPIELAEALKDAPHPEHALLRAPEIGAVMVRGRAGAHGAPFNLGEMTVTRASVQLGSGTVGHGYVQGRDKAHAERAAVADALLQDDAGGALYDTLIKPLEAAQAARRQSKREKAAATKVDFFTMERGHN